MKKETGKHRLYTGQLICSENYNNFTSEQRNFWQKAHRAFLKGKMYFNHNGQVNIVPFRFSDGSFDTVLTNEKLNEQVEKVRADIEAKTAEGIEVRDSLERKEE